VIVAADGGVVATANITAVNGAGIPVIAGLGDEPTVHAHDSDAAEHAARTKVFIEATITVVVDRVAGGVVRDAGGCGVGSLQRLLLELNRTSLIRLAGTTERTHRN
jgi:hypothetical protein